MGSINVGGGGSLAISGGNLSVIGGGGGGGGTDPSTRSDLKLRFLAGDYSSIVANNWYPTGGNSTRVNVYYASGWALKATERNDGSVPSFNGQGSVYVGGGSNGTGTIANNYNSGGSLDAPGGSSARTIYMVAYIPDTTVPEVCRLFSYGSYNGGGSVGFSFENGYIYGTALGYDYNTGSPSFSSTKGAPITAGTPFVVSYAYAAGSDLKDNDLYVNGTAGTYGSGSGSVIHSADNGSGIVGSDFLVQFNWKLNGIDPTNYGLTHYVADVLVFNTAHDSATRQAIEAWLISQYGI